MVRPPLRTARWPADPICGRLAPEVEQIVDDLSLAGGAAQDEACALPVVHGDAGGREHLANERDASQPLAAHMRRIERRRRIEPAPPALEHAAQPTHHLSPDPVQVP
jgi:hypothetical protein